MKTKLLLAVFTLLVDFPLAAQRPDREAIKELKGVPQLFLQAVHSYLTMVTELRALADDPRIVLIVAQHDMKELYGQKGAPGDVVKEFRRILKEVKDPAVRTMLRFSIADSYKEADEPQKALEELRALVAENLERVEGESR